MCNNHTLKLQVSILACSNHVQEPQQKHLMLNYLWICQIGSVIIIIIIRPCKSEKSTVSAISWATGFQTECHTLSSEVRTFQGKWTFSFPCLETHSMFAPSFLPSWCTSRWTESIVCAAPRAKRNYTYPSSQPPQLAVLL